MKKDNRGLTLIELIVTIAIIAIFSGVVLTFVGTGANSYRNTSNNAEAQMETQQALDQIQNIIIDTNRSVYYAAGKGINENIGEVIYSDIDEGDSRSKTFFATSAVPLSDPDQPNSYKYVCEAIEWDFDEKKLYYGSRTWEGTETFHSDGGGGTALDNGQEGGSGTPDSQNGNQVLNTGNSNGISDEMTLSNGNSSVTRNRTSEIITKVPRTVLAEDITGFEVDITKAPKEQIIRFQLYTEKRGKKIRTLHTVNLRNRVQIAPPGADYGTADPTGAWIRITRYPEIMYPGDSSSEFDKLMDGNINLETVKWVVESGNGEFTSNSNKSAILKVSDQAKQGDKIVVHVEAQTTNGERVQSQSVKIRIESPKVPESIKPDKPSILLGVGNFYDLKDIVSWKVKYTNGEDGEKINNSRIKWSIENPVPGIEFKGSVLVIKDILGTDGSNSNFTLKAEYTISDGKKLSGEVKAVLARIDILKPYGEYTVGDEKTFEFAYKEGGTSVQLTGALPQLKVESAPVDLGNPYTPGDAFTEEEIGDWKVSTEFPVSKRNGYGTVRDVSTFTVKKDSVTAEIVVVDNKTTIFPGESLQFWLKLTDKNGTILDGSAEWQSQLTDTIKEKSQISVKENLNTYTAPTSGSSSQDTITADYRVDYNGKTIQGTVSKDIYITYLTMTLNHQHDTLYFGMEPEVITARIIDASNNIEVTNRYDIQWTIAPTDASYSIEGKGNIADFKVNSAVSTDKVVTVTAIAKVKNNSSITCSATTTLRVNSKETKVKSYDCSADQTKKLEFDPEDSSQKLQQMKVSYLPAIGGSPVSVEINKIPTLTLTGTTPVDLSITMNQDSGNFDQYKYILISAELETVLYNFYIYPIKNNIYDGEYGTATNAIAYAPYDLESIKKLATLLPEGYTYRYIDNTNTLCEIRLSIHTKTGVGTFEGLLWNSSMNKWFMKRGDIYYKYHNGGWYEFNNGSSHLYKHKYTQYYWKLDERPPAFEGIVVDKNTMFWQKWN